MKNFSKILVLILTLSLLVLALALTASAEGEANTPSVIIVGETTNPDTDTPYTLEEAWAKSEEVGTDKLEVVVKTNNDAFESDFAKVSISDRKTVLQLTSDVKTASALSTVKGATVTIDVSGCTLEITKRFTLTGNGAELIFRTSTAAGKIVCSSTSSNQALFSSVTAKQSAMMRFVSANNSDKLLTVEYYNHLITFGNSTAGTSSFDFNGGLYKANSTHAVFSLNSAARVAPSTLKIHAADASFQIGSYFMLHNTSTSYEANVGAFGMDSAISFERCTFTTNQEKTVNFFNNNDRLKGRYFGTFTLEDCSLTQVSPNFNVLYTYVNASTNESGETVYDTNYPLASGDGTFTLTANLGYDYRPEAVAAGYDGTNRVFFHGFNTFESISSGHIKTDRTGFNANNVAFTENTIFYATSGRTIAYTGDGLISDEADLLAYVDLTNEYGIALSVALANDVENAQGVTLKPNGDLTVDLKGHTLAMTHTASNIRFYVRGKLHIYSSEAGGRLTSASTLSMFFMNDNYSPVLTLGRDEDAKENLTVEANAGFVVFGNTFNGAMVKCNVTNATVSTAGYFIKFNAKATADTKPTVQFDFKGCDIRIAHKGFLAYNENEALSSDKESANNGIIAYGSYVNTDGCTISCDADDSNVLFSAANKRREEGGASIPTFQGAFFGTVTFKNTHFKNVLLNFEYMSSTEENKLLNGKNEDYVIPEDWDVTKQVTLLEGCTFDMDGQRGIHSDGNAFSYASNVTLKDGYVLARTAEADTFAILSRDEAVTLTWELTSKTVTVHYQSGSPVHTPSLEGLGTTVNNNYYYLTYAQQIPALATEDATYTVRYAGGATLSANYTLNVAIDFHAYVPATSEILKINGIAVGDLETRTVGDATYYKVTFTDLAPKDAYKSKLVSLTVNLGGEEVTVDRYISLIGYAEAAIKSNLDQRTLNLVLATMDYINKANMYFGGEGVARIESLLLANGFTPYVWQAQNVKEIGIYENICGAALDLNQTPGFVIYVKADYAGTVTVNGVSYNEYSESLVMDGVEVKYIVVKVAAYKMADDLTVTAGNDTLVYNLDTYIAGKAQDEPYAHALYGYVMACKSYIA